MPDQQMNYWPIGSSCVYPKFDLSCEDLDDWYEKNNGWVSVFLLYFGLLCLIVAWPHFVITPLVFIIIAGLWRKRQTVRDIPFYFFLLLSLFLAWYPILNEKNFYFSTFHPEWGFVPSPFWVVICFILAVIELIAWNFHKKNDLEKSSPSVVSNPFHQWYSRGLGLATAMILFIGIGGFFLNDYERLANWTVLPSTQESNTASDPEGSDPTQSTNTPASRRTLNEVGEFSARIVFPLVGGIAIIVTLIFNALRTTAMMEQTKNTTETLKNSQEQIKITQKQLDNSQKQIRSEQFKNAIDHLGNDKQAIVLGGVHALYDLALNYEEYRKQVFEILCSFIREETRKLKYQKRKNSDDSNTTVTSSIVIQTIIDKLFREKESQKFYIEAFKEKQADLSGAFLPEINLQNAYIPNIFLLNVNLQRAHLSGVNLQGAFLFGVNLQRTDLRNANLQGVQTWENHFRYAFYDKTGLPTDLSGITLYDDEDNELDFTEDEKKEWFRKKGANVDDLSAEEVQRIGKELGW